MHSILVVGATGTVGSRVVAALSGEAHVRAGVRVLAATRSAAKAAHLASENVTPIDFDFDAPGTMRAALDGVDRVFAITTPAEHQEELVVRLIDAARAAGVRHIVKLSAFGVDSKVAKEVQLGRMHRASEGSLAASGIPCTFVRANSFFENFINYYAPQKDGNIYLPWGTGACSFIAVDDVAAVAALALTSAGHEGKKYDLTGPESLTIAEVARTIGQAAGRTIAYVDVPEEAARKAMLAARMPGWLVEQLIEIHAVTKLGHINAVTDTVARLLRRPATTLAAFAKEHAAAWRS